MVRGGLIAWALLGCACARGAGPTAIDPLGRPPAVGVASAQLALLDRLATLTPDSDPYKPDLLFRQASLYDQESRYWAHHGDELKRERWRLAAIKRELEIIDTPAYAGYPRRDEVLFALASGLTEVHKEQAARKFFKLLIQEHPTSPRVADAFVVFGDYFFELHDYENAQQFYFKVLQFPRARARDYARYKLAWCAFNDGNYREAAEDFAAVAREAAEPELVSAAEHDLELARARAGGGAGDLGH
jgi:tetratricopeptide (TPR) repeat protein